MIIDNTNDDSVMRLLQMSGILNSSHSFYKLSGMKEGSEIEQLNLVSRVKFAAQQGDKTVVMSQVEEVSECFYDLFNQHFTEFKKEGKVLYFANIAIGGISRPCIIHPSFQCIVHVQSNQLDEIPSPYLNRFEKFQLNIDDILSWQLTRLPRGINAILSAALNKCKELSLMSNEGNGSIWSTSPDETLKSLFISMIPPDIDSFRQSNGQVSVSPSICSSVVGFLKSWFIVDVSIDDIEQSIAIALSELHGINGIELRKVLDMEGCLDQSQLEQSFHDVASGVHDSPLSRSLNLITQVSIMRNVIFRLLLLATPEAVFLQRDYLPKDILRAYFGQEHFHLKSLISKLTQSKLGHRPHDCQLYMLHVHSDLCAHSLPTWCGDGHTIRTPEEIIFKSKVESIVHENPSSIQIHHLDLLKSESSVRILIDSWASKEEVCCFILVVDMQLQCSSNLVNFIRAHIEQVSLAPTKQFLLLLHYPLSYKNPSYPALFLGNWQCAYLDGIGYHGVSSSILSVNNVFEAACFEECQLNADSLHAALLPKAAQYVASQVSYYSCSPYPQSVNQEMQFTERLIKIEAVLKRQLKGESLGKLLCKKYLSMWTENAIRDMLHRSAHGLKSGTTHLSLSTAVRSIFQHTFNRFLANCIQSDINMWSNLDILDDACSDSETDEIFLMVLSALPGIPLKELELHRGLCRHLNPLPLEVTPAETLVFFPFYYHVSSFIDMALDKANTGSLENNSWIGHQNIDFSSLVASVDEMLDVLLKDPSASSLPIDESMVEIVRDIIVRCEASSGLYEKYLKHNLLWKYGIRNSSQVIKWTSKKIKDMFSSTSPCHQNIVKFHIVCRMNVIDIIRMSSWDSVLDSTEHLEDNSSAEDAKFEGPQFVGTMLGHFKSSLCNNCVDMKQWSHSFSTFLQSIPNLVGGEAQIGDRSMIVALRQLVFFSVIISANAPETSVSQMVEDVNVQTEHTLCDFFELLGDGITWVKDAKEKLLRAFFSPWWLKSISDIGHADANFLIDSIKRQLIKHQMAVVHLRNLLLHGTNNNHNKTQHLHPTKCFSQSIALLICRSLSCQGISDFCTDSQQRKGIPHYVPSWLCSNTHSVTGDEIVDGISWFFQDYTNAFDCPLADAIFDIMLYLLVDTVRSCSSEQLLLVLQQTIERERAVSHKEQVRCKRQALQPSQKETVSFVGSCLAAIEADALLVCFVCKIAEELSTESQASALCGIGSHSAIRVLDIIMGGSHKWTELFFSVILRLRGEGHLASLLGDGGALNSFEWCKQWMQGISSLHHDILADLTEARGSLQQAREDAEYFSRQYRACPHCRGLFGVDQRNCGQFECGRDAHGVNGGPAVGGQAIRETFGCGRTFTLDQALPYEQSNQHTEDHAALQELREGFETKQQLFNDFNKSAKLWERAEQFKAPCISFHVQREHVDGLFPCTNLVDLMPKGASNPGAKLLISILKHLPTLEHLSYLPDMIELYVFVHKTFRHVVTKDMSMNMKIGDVMDERLLTHRFGSIDGAHLQNVWFRVVEGVNAFLCANNSVVAWNCEEVNVPFCDLKNASLISILSEMEHPSEGHDYLFLIINELVLRYNNFIKSMNTIASSSNADQKVEEIHPRTLVRSSKGSIIVNQAISNTPSVIENLVESYWIKEDRNFNMESLTKAICYDMGTIGQLQPIKSPLSFLRDKFAFRECSLNAGQKEDASETCFCSSDGLFFARNGDLSLYEEVKESAKRSGFGEGKTNNLRHTMIVTFQTSSHDDWTGLLEGLRNVFSHLQGSDFLRGEQQFGQAVINSFGTPNSLQRFGFPALNDTQANFLNSITKNDVMELVCVCGEQLSSEAYRFVGIPSRLAEPLSKDTKDSMREGIVRLLKSKSSTDVISELDAFSKDVLEFYLRLIVDASESSNEGLSSFLKRNNCCDETDNIFAAIPHMITIRNFIDVQKVLLQAHLKLLFDSREMAPSTDVQHSGIRKCKSSKWKWVARTQSEEEAPDEDDERYHWKAYGHLWFEDALSKGSIAPEETKTESEEIDNSDSDEKKEDASASTMDGDHNDTATLPENIDPSTLVNEDALTEQEIDVDAQAVEDTSTDEQVNEPIFVEDAIERGKIEDEMEDEEVKMEDTTTHLHSNAEKSADRTPTVPFILGTALIIVAIFVIAAVFFNHTRYTSSFNQYLDDVDAEESLEEVLGYREYQGEVGSNDEACSDGDEE